MGREEIGRLVSDVLAEAYSLYKVEPQFLEREYPELYDYFNSRRHLR